MDGILWLYSYAQGLGVFFGKNRKSTPWLDCHYRWALNSRLHTDFLSPGDIWSIFSAAKNPVLLEVVPESAEAVAWSQPKSGKSMRSSVYLGTGRRKAEREAACV